MKRRKKTSVPRILGVAVVVLVMIWVAQVVVRGTAATGTGEAPAIEELLAYNESIRLTDAQEAVHVEALEGMPAPCCDTFTAATCCCECNLARAIWGLSKHLVTEGHGASQVRDRVAAWTAEVNPDGFTGDACFEGNCKRPFDENGCGGMDRDHLIF